MSPMVQIKGIREGLLVVLGEGDWPELHSSLLDLIVQQRDFLRGAKIYLEVGNQILNAAEMGQLRDEISEQGLNLWGVITNSPKTEQTAQMLGLATKLSRQTEKTIQRTQGTPDTNLSSGEDAILIRRTLRSGFSIRHEGHVIIIGDVNPGAEIVAGGSVVVWGNLRGVVSAGSGGDQTAVVCALELAPVQLRIAGTQANLPKSKGKASPVLVKLLDEQIITENWIPAKDKSGGLWPLK